MPQTHNSTQYSGCCRNFTISNRNCNALTWVPVALGTLHQAGAVILLGSLLALLHGISNSAREAVIWINHSFCSFCRLYWSSLRATGSTTEGAPIIKSSALPFVGTRLLHGYSARLQLTSLCGLCGAIPPCGGAPKRNALIIAGNFSSTTSLNSQLSQTLYTSPQANDF